MFELLAYVATSQLKLFTVDLLSGQTQLDHKINILTDRKYTCQLRIILLFTSTRQ